MTPSHDQGEASEGLKVYVHLHRPMSVKTITITEEAYRRLRRLKREGESFSDVISRVVPETSPLDLVGVLDPETGDRLVEAVRRVRREVEDRVRETASEMGP